MRRPRIDSLIFNTCLFTIIVCCVKNSFGASSNRFCNKSISTITPTKHCIICPINAALIRCPSGTTQLTSHGILKCILSSKLYGCVHLCKTTTTKRVCCKDHWGYDCKECPGLESGKPACFGNGQCADLDYGNGTCTCNPGFEGYACELCSNTSRYGEKCAKECTCKHGRCDSGVLGNGTCIPLTCDLGYHGVNCDQFEPKCNKSCHNYSHCFVNGESKDCKCNPGYTGDGLQCEEIDPCAQPNVSCPLNAVCSKTGPGRYKCKCALGFTGDGVVCTAIDPCQISMGNCSKNTQCNYLAPGKSNCSCLPGYGNYIVQAGCDIINECDLNDCRTFGAECFMSAPGVKECRCKNGYVGNGTVCYGSILEKVIDLHATGPYKNKLRNIQTIIKHHADLTLAFAKRGPFTVFLPTDDGLNKAFTSRDLYAIIGDSQMVHDLVMAHSAAAFLPSSLLQQNGQLTTLKGFQAMVSVAKDRRLSYQLNNRSEKPNILSPDIFASNGVIHVIDGVAWKPDLTKTSRTSKTLWQMISDLPEAQTFKELVEIARMTSVFQTSSNGSTVIAPVNEAFERLDNETMSYLQSPTGRVKLEAIIKNHVFPSKFGVIDISRLSSLTSLAPETVSVTVNEKGSVILGNVSRLINSNNIASDGYLHLADNVLLPLFVLPIIQKFCDNRTKLGPCRDCGLTALYPRCPNEYVPTGETRTCSYYRNTGFSDAKNSGCRAVCKPKRRKCCEGFYGSDCLPCPGPIGNPCFGNGKCSSETGICKCNLRFAGTACELCKDNRTFGLECKRNCSCVHGTCDNGPKGNGFCVPGTCKRRYSGKDCGLVLKPCYRASSRRLKFSLCHAHGRCYLQNSKPTCVCLPGYRKVGSSSCYEINPCLRKDRGGCHQNAICRKTRPGQNTCTCNVGWTGDGFYCVPINYCIMPSRGHCHGNAKCTFTGPAQVKCTCNRGYDGDGTKCQENNPCLRLNGKCSPLATCVKTGPGERNCICHPEYHGDGITCRPTLSLKVKREAKLRIMSKYITKYNLLRYMIRNESLTFFLPSDDAIKNANETAQRLLDSFWNFFVFGGVNAAPGQYTYSDLKNRSLTHLQSWFLDFNITISHTESAEPLIGGSAKIIKPDIKATNGIIHIVDKVLVPDVAWRNVTKESDLYEFLCVQEKKSFSQFCKKIEEHKLTGNFKNCSFCTVFVPTDQTLNVLHWTHWDELKKEDILFHATDNYIREFSVLKKGQQFSTLAGTYYKVFLQKKNKTVYINDIKASLYKTKQTYVVYSITKVLRAVENTCFKRIILRQRMKCQPCTFSRINCQNGFFFERTTLCYFQAFGRRRVGCQTLCVKLFRIPQCCPGFYGFACSACPNVHGKVCNDRGHCDDKQTGSGHCNCTGNFDGVACEMCKKGYWGPNCDKKYLPCGHEQCPEHSSCGKDNSTCKCDSGFNMTNGVCQRNITCKDNLSDCSPNAKCKHIDKSPWTKCSCKTNYQGDGYVCQGVNLCSNKSRTPCSENATCVYLRPGRAACKCPYGYTGSGLKNTKCMPIDRCANDNGGCSFNAKCSFDFVSLNTTCKCLPGFIGDGYTCTGNAIEVIQNDPDLSEFHSRLMSSSITNALGPENHYTLVVPHNKAFSSRRRKRHIVDESDIDLNQYIISCVVLSVEDLNSTNQIFTTLDGSNLVITAPMVINNTIRIQNVTVIANSAILIVDELLRAPVQRKNHSHHHMTFMEAAMHPNRKRNYSMFVNLLNKTIILDRLPYKRPHTMFWPTNEAITSLPEDIRSQLFNNMEYARKIISYHIIDGTNVTATEVLGYAGGLWRKTRARSSVFVSCMGGKGDFYVNGRSRIVERDITFLEGVAFGISQMLLPAGIAGRCDKIVDEKFKGRCTACFDFGSCPPGSTLLGVTNSSCFNEKSILGCSSLCTRRNTTRECCKHFYGADCQACPGGLTPCSGIGECNDGLSGNGTCFCHESHFGRNCEKCGSNVSKCIEAKAEVCSDRKYPCSIFASCDITRPQMCQCTNGYEGDGYYCQEIDRCLKNNGGCNDNAVCRYVGPNLTRCECRSGFVGNGIDCLALPPDHPCLVNNGNCDPRAFCTDEGGRAKCRCPKDFIGDGYYCSGSLMSIIDYVEELSDFSKAFKQLPHGGAYHFKLLLSGKQEYTVFAPINYGHVKKMNLDLVKNHIAKGYICLPPGQTKDVQTLNGTHYTLSYSKDGKTMKIQNFAKVKYEIPARNGMIYVIDHVLVHRTVHPHNQEVPVPKPTTPSTRSPPKASKDVKTSKYMIIGIVLGVVVVALIIAITIFMLKRRRSYNIKYQKHPSAEQGDTLRNPIYIGDDSPDDALDFEMTESSVAPLTEYDAVSLSKKPKS
ncbi:stabilin-2-like isoform X2 [Xenia sp. Carnegie-2017]|uniref:stabilin-2-like isoform X2 n=1 Tax=Xenia sp. Carnegie-2017 TaxID=2897299 RepID=UPI001F040964|nr:stabilin-2-like isoform X2 [Xenia sp. Carnegie-2017]